MRRLPQFFKNSVAQRSPFAKKYHLRKPLRPQRSLREINLRTEPRRKKLRRLSQFFKKLRGSAFSVRKKYSVLKKTLCDRLSCSRSHEGTEETLRRLPHFFKKLRGSVPSVRKKTSAPSALFARDKFTHEAAEPRRKRLRHLPQFFKNLCGSAFSVRKKYHLRKPLRPLRSLREINLHTEPRRHGGNCDVSPISSKIFVAQRSPFAKNIPS